MNPQDDASNKNVEEAFAVKLKKATFQQHGRVQQTTFAQDLTRGNLSIDVYSNYLAALYVVYNALEEELSILSKADERIAKVYFPKELNRLDAIGNDLNEVYGKNWKTEILRKVEVDPAIKKYKDRIHEIAQSEPLRLLSHAYTRYMGDLSGGQMLKGKIGKALGFPAGQTEGLEFYEFPVEDPKAFKDVFRDGLNAAVVTEADQQAVIDEVDISYDLNYDLLIWIHSAEANQIQIDLATNNKVPQLENKAAEVNCCVIA